MEALADVVWGTHLAYVAFLLGWPPTCLGLVLLGRRAGWLRGLGLLHLGLLAFAAAEFLLGFACPLTALEAALRGAPPGDGLIELARHPLAARVVPAWALLWAGLSLAALALLRAPRGAAAGRPNGGRRSPPSPLEPPSKGEIPPSGWP
jgi:hypothetical protein